MATKFELAAFRSSLNAAMADVMDIIRSLARFAGAEVEGAVGYPGWQPNPSSRVLEVARRSFSRVFGDNPEIIAVHAGLEWGIIGERVPGMDMVSFGPDIKGAHSPGERVHIGSVKRFWQLLIALLDDLSC